MQEYLLKYSQHFYYFYTHIHILFWGRFNNPTTQAIESQT